MTHALLLVLALSGQAGAATAFSYTKAPRQPVTLVDSEGREIERTADGHLEVAVHDPVTAFGELAVSEYTPLIQGHFVYANSFSTESYQFFQSAGASTGIASNMASCSSGSTATLSLCSIRTARSLVYHPGQGSLGRWTADFSTAVAGTIQFTGFGNAETALGFTANEYGLFGIVRSSGGVRHTVVMGIHTKSSNAQNVTVTLNNQAFTCAVTNGADARVTANEISQCDFSGLYPGWVTEAQGSSVTFIPTVPGSQGGTFSATFPTSGGATFTTLFTGKNPNVEFVRQSEWNIDTLDGSGSTRNPSGLNLDYTGLNVYQLAYQYLGAGQVVFSVESPRANGSEGEEMLPVHRISYAGRETTPSLSNPSMPFVISSRNVGVASDVVVKSASFAAFTQGPHITLGRERSYGVTKSGITTAWTPLLTLNNSRLFGERVNQSELLVESIQISNVGTKGLEIQVLENAIVGNDRSWVYVSTNTSPARVDFSATTYSSGIPRISRGVPSNTQAEIDASRYSMNINSGGRITVLGRATNTTTDATVSIQWAEDQ